MQHVLAIEEARGQNPEVKARLEVDQPGHFQPTWLGSWQAERRGGGALPEELVYAICLEGARTQISI